MSARNHVVITGTGRAGTTFLMELLTHLGLDTGFSVETLSDHKCSDARAGLEASIRNPSCPYIVKSPEFCECAQEIVRRDDVIIDHVFVPMRDLAAAAESRRYVQEVALSKMSLLHRLQLKMGLRTVRGGLCISSFRRGFWTKRPSRKGEQEVILLERIYKLVLALSETPTPITFMQYPKIIMDDLYLFEKLKPILNGVTHESFHKVFTTVTQPKLISSFSNRDR